MARNLKGIGDAIRRFRREKGLTQEELALAAHTSQVVIHKLEAGKGVHLTTLLEVMKALNVEMAFNEIKPIDTKNLADLIQ